MPEPDSFVDQLRAAAQPQWSAAVEHRFVDELFAGTLQDQHLAHYLVQDYQFCDAFVALLGQAVASAPSLESRLGHAGQLGAFAGDENSYFLDSFDALGVTDHDRVDPIRTQATNDFNSLMVQTRESLSYPRILAVLLVAEWLYLEWAQTDRVWPERPEHRGWIEVHNNPEFVAWVDWLKAELNRHAPTDPTERAELQELFREATKLELAFFDDVYESFRAR